MDYVLSLSKWRCGGGTIEDLAALEPEDHYYTRGTGPTRLENSDGFMCCLGQFARQVIVASENPELIAACTDMPSLDPEGLGDYLHGLKMDGIYDSSFVWKSEGTQCPYSLETITTYHVTPLASKLMVINDDPALLVAEKLHRIKKELMLYGHTLKVVQ